MYAKFGYLVECLQKDHGVPFLIGGSPIVLIILIIWGIGLFGLLLGWWKEKLGGFLSLSCFILVFILNLFNQESQGKMVALLPMVIFCIPSLLFISCWYDAIKDSRLKEKKLGQGRSCHTTRYSGN